MTANDDNLVWSDERGGAIGGSPSKRSRGKKKKSGEPKDLSSSGFPDDGVVRVCREKSGRGGKTVTVLYGVPGADRSRLLKKLKAGCGCGGTQRGAFLEIQGDQRDKVMSVLEKEGFEAKLAGG